MLTGLVACGSCGHRMHASYPSKSTAYYSGSSRNRVGSFRASAACK
ncbi:MAG: zinc ribbon domain-containing protein [Rubrobacteraceae bacterium]